MKFHFGKERILAIVAHPDDAELLCAGTLARARSEGAAIAICVCCRGDKGQPEKTIRNLAEVRRGEMRVAARELGAELFVLNVPDSTLADSTPNRRKLTGILRRFRATLVLAHAPEDYHPDHRAASALAEAATWFSASRGYSLTPAPLPHSPALWWMDTLTMAGFEPGFFVDISAWMKTKESMLRCHKSQLQRSSDRDFSPLAELMHTQARMRGLQSGVAAAEAFRAHLAFKRAQAW